MTLEGQLERLRWKVTLSLTPATLPKERERHPTWAKSEPFGKSSQCHRS